MGELTSVRPIITLEWTARDKPDGPFFQGIIRVETHPMDDGETAVILKDHSGQMIHAYRVWDMPVSWVPDAARKIVAVAVAGLRSEHPARYVAARLEYRLKTATRDAGYDDLCACYVGAHPDDGTPDRDCPLHGEHPLTVQGVNS